MAPGRRGCVRNSSLILGLLECFLFSVVFVGWPNLVVVYKHAGVFANLCSDNNNNTTYTDTRTESGDVMMTSSVTCGDVDFLFNLCFIITQAVTCFASMLTGIIFDRYGLWFTRIVTTLCFVPGIVCLAFVSDGWTSYLIFPGLTMTGAGGSMIMTVAPHLVSQAGRNRSTLAGLYTGAMDSSVAVFLVVQILFEKYTISYTYSLAAVAALWTIFIFHTFVLLPKYKLNKEDDIATSQEIIIQDDVANREIKPVQGKTTPCETNLKDCLKSPLYSLMLVWFTVLELKLVFYVGSLNFWLELELPNDEVQHFVSVFSYVAMCGIFISPFVGLIIDVADRRGIGTLVADPWLGKAKSAAPAIWIGSILSLLHSVVLLFFNRPVIYLSLILMLFYRSFLYGVTFSYIQHVFPMNVLGKCQGLIFLSAGIFSWLQLGMFEWAQHLQSFKEVGIVVLVMNLTVFALPIYIEVAYSQQRRDLVTTRL